MRRWTAVLPARAIAAVAIAAVAALALGMSPTARAQAAGALPAPASSTLQKIRQTGVITLAHRESSIPFSYLDAERRPVGYSIDLCLRVVDALRRELRQPGLRVAWLPVDSAARIPALLGGRADIECGGTTNTAARRQQVAFSVTHFFAGGRLLVRSDAGIDGLSGLRQRRIATTRGSTHLRYLNDRIERGMLAAKVIEVPDPAAGLAAVEDGSADAFLFDDIVLYSLRASARNPSALAVVGAWTTVEPLALMLRKDDAEFKRVIDTTLARLMVDGEIGAIYRRWFRSAIPPRGVTLDVEVSPLLRDQFRFPTDKVGDDASG